jgi:hypothetical protein
MERLPQIPHRASNTGPARPQAPPAMLWLDQ